MKLIGRYRSGLSLDPRDAAYTAGLIDGEGTITLSREHRNENPRTPSVPAPSGITNDGPTRGRFPFQADRKSQHGASLGRPDGANPRNVDNANRAGGRRIFHRLHECRDHVRQRDEAHAPRGLARRRQALR